jgi:hypothetical protein
MLSTAKRVGNRIIGNPEQTVTTISTESYLKGLVKDPKHEVRNSYIFSVLDSNCVVPGGELFYQSFPNPWMDLAIQ